MKRLFVLLILIVEGCSHHDITLEKVHQTSDYLHCDKVFATNRKSIIELNEILIQTGIIDTLDDKTVRAAVIHTNGRELIMNLTKTDKTGNSCTEEYAGKGYRLRLSYKAEKAHSSTNYNGNCQLWHSNLYTRLSIAGIDNKL